MNQVAQKLLPKTALHASSRQGGPGAWRVWATLSLLRRRWQAACDRELRQAGQEHGPPSPRRRSVAAAAATFMLKMISGGHSCGQLERVQLLDLPQNRKSPPAEMDKKTPNEIFDIERVNCGRSAAGVISPCEPRLSANSL